MNIWEVEGIRKSPQKKYPEGKGVLKRTDPLTIIAGFEGQSKSPKRTWHKNGQYGKEPYA